MYKQGNTLPISDIRGESQPALRPQNEQHCCSRVKVVIGIYFMLPLKHHPFVTTLKFIQFYLYYVLRNF